MGAISDSELSRRDVLKLGAGAVAGAAALSVARSLPAAAAPSNLNEMTVAQMQAAMASKQLSSLDLVNYYLTRINTLDKAGPTVNSVIEVNPDAKAIAQRTPDPSAPATATNRNRIPADYTAFLNPNGLSGARIGVCRDFSGHSPDADAVFETALNAMGNAGAILVDPVTFPHINDINSGSPEFTVLLFDFKADLQKYFATRTGVPLAGGTLADAIAFNNAHAAQEMPFFAQEIFDLAELFDITSTTAIQPLGLSYDDSIAMDKLFGATEGIDKLLADFNLDAIVAPTDSPAFPTDLINSDHFVFGSSTPAAIVGYPIINVPMGMTFGVPVGISFMASAFSEPTLIKLASGFEAVTHARQEPKFLATLPFNTRGLPNSVKRRKLQPSRVAPFRI